MDCGDAGHILLSRRVAEDLEQYRQWQPHLHDLGEWKTFRSLGCSPITHPVASAASTIDDIIAELEATRTSERTGRAQDHRERNAIQ
jgi:3'-phosphoadenosine 5'-phosphosulfate sulfotransferase (PAPS reductase)/FAD synthetase